MDIEIVIHRGYKDLYDNSLIGIVSAISRGRACEFDVLYNGEWVLAHDFHSVNRRNAPLKDLVKVLLDYPIYWKKYVLLDVKWDFVINQPDNIELAIQELFQLLEPFQTSNLLVQASSDTVFHTLLEKRQDFHKWKLGKIMTNIDDGRLYSNDLSFLTIDLHQFPIQILEQIPQHIYIIGYTCKHIDDLKQYYISYKGYINALVCDLTIHDEEQLKKRGFGKRVKLDLEREHTY